MIAGIDCNRVDGSSGNQRVISYDAPRSHIAATVGCLPYTATDGSKIRYDTAIDGSSRIDRNRVHASFGRCVIETPRTTGHPFRLWTERGKSSRDKRKWTHRVELLMSTSRHAT